MATIWLLLQRVTRALWFLPALFSLLALGVVVLALLASQIFPESLGSEDPPLDVSADAVLNILSIVASSMLAVTVFALSTLVNLLTSTAQTSSPRAVPLIIADRAAQTSISVFIGAFLFSVVGIIGLTGRFYTAFGRLILFVATIFVVLAVIWGLLRWIREISLLGRVGETIGRVERASRHALERVGPGALYGCGPRRSEPADALPVKAEHIGFVQHFDPERLQSTAERQDLRIHVVSRPGMYVDYSSTLAWVEGDADEKALKAVRSSFLIGVERTFEFDPGYGFTVLSEIARRALSPAVNDPNTAIQVVTVQTRLLGEWLRAKRDLAKTGIYDRVTLTPLTPGALLDAAFRDVIRDAAGSLDVTLAVLRGLRTLSDAAPEDLRGPASRLTHDVAERAGTIMPHEADEAEVRRAAAKLAETPL